LTALFAFSAGSGYFWCDADRDLLDLAAQTRWESPSSRVFLLF
jgi:hypothetical protein